APTSRPLPPHSRPPRHPHSLPTRRSSDLHVHRRVADAGVNVARLLEGKQLAGVLRIAEHVRRRLINRYGPAAGGRIWHLPAVDRDRKSTRLNSSHVKSSYAVFCLKKKNAR